MSALVLMAESWHPTVLQILPFSNNNAKTRPDSRESNEEPREVTSASRGFPVLAVTRSKNFDTSTTKSKLPDSRPNSESPLVRGTICAITTNKNQSKEGPNETESCFSVEDIDDHVISPKKIREFIQDNGRLSSAKTLLFESSGNTNLPKPKIKSGNPNSDHRVFPPRNGIRRPVTLTPGEMELQKYKEDYAKEQAQKKRKYKLNVNQLPRSTTPINDHDPDRLNMKQVIAFLQTKATRSQMEPAKPSEITLDTTLRIGKQTELKNISRSLRRSQPEAKTKKEFPSAYAFANGDTHYLTTPSIRSDVSDNVSVISTKTQDLPLRESNCKSVLSTHSTPSLPKKNRPSAISHKSNASRPYSDRSRVHSDSEKPNKEFKLHRFLALAPNGMGQTTPLSLSRDREVAVHRSIPRKAKDVDITATAVHFRSPRLQKSPKDAHRTNKSHETNDHEKPRISTTANLVHRRYARRQLENTDSENEAETDRMSNTIRLPHVSTLQDDVDSDSDIADDMSFSTAATYNTHRRDNAKEERMTLPKFMTLSDNYNIQREQVIDKRESLASSRLSLSNSRDTLVSSRDTITSSQECLSQNNRAQFRKIHINLPVEDSLETESKQHDIVRLALRHERDKTREMSYMSDIAKTVLQDESKYMRNAPVVRSHDSPCYLCDMEGSEKHQISSRALLALKNDSDKHRLNEHPRHITDVKISRSQDRHFIHPTTISVQQTTSQVTDESPNSTLANSCIKVRQKLKAHLQNEAEME